MDQAPLFEVVPAQSATDEQRMAAAVILSAHWRKDPATRAAEISKSTNSFPLHLILLRRASAAAPAVAIGHCRLTKVDGTEQPAALVESGLFSWTLHLSDVVAVIVDPAERSKGLGRLLMTAAEKTAKELRLRSVTRWLTPLSRLGYKVMYLNTKDKMGFYAHLGTASCTSPLTFTRLHRVRTSQFARSQRSLDQPRTGARLFCAACTVVDSRAAIA